MYLVAVIISFKYSVFCFRLTAFVLQSFAQARPWIDIDEKLIKKSSNWLLKIQDSYGCFPKVGALHNKAMAGGVKTSVTLTAYVLISLLEANLTHSSVAIRAASECVLGSLDGVKDSYSLALISYMFAKVKDTKNYEKIMERLNKKAIKLG